MRKTCRVNSKYISTVVSIYKYLYPDTTNEFKFSDIPCIERTSADVTSMVNEGWMKRTKKGTRCGNSYVLTPWGIAKISALIQGDKIRWLRI